VKPAVRMFSLVFAVGVLAASVCQADHFIRGAGGQGTFDMKGGQASLSQGGDGGWQLRFALPAGGGAGVWASAPGRDSPAKGSHVLRYSLTLESDTDAPVLATWEIKGSAGMQSVPLVLRRGGRTGQAVLDWSRIGEWKEGVLALQPPGGGVSVTGVLRVQAEFIRWPAWYAVMASSVGRWGGVLLAALLSAMVCFVLRQSKARAVQGGPSIKMGWFSVWIGVAVMLGLGSVLAILGTASSVPGQSAITPLLVTVAGVVMAGIFTRLRAGRFPTAGEAFRHALISGLLVMTASDIAIWTTVVHGNELGRISRLGAVVFWVTYQVATVRKLGAEGRSLSVFSSLRIVSVPFLFGLLLCLPNRDLMGQVGGFLLPVWGAVATGRMLFLMVFNVLVAWVCLGSWKALRARGPDLWVLPLAAVATVVSPWVADAGSGLFNVAGVWRVLVSMAATVLSQAALWAEAYLLTGLMLDAVRGSAHHRSRELTGYARVGAVKGMWFGCWVMGLLQAGALVMGSSWWSHVCAVAPLLTWAVAGGVVFPLAKTLIESFDGSPSFVRRLWNNYQRRSLVLRGAVVGWMAAWGWSHQFVDWSLPMRAGWGFVAGVGAYAGISLLRDVALGVRGRGGVGGWRLYVVKAVLGGLVGAALGFYLDAAQTPVIANKLVVYLGFGMKPVPYEVYPLLSRWGFLPLGDYAGGVRLLWNEALAGVISWGVAAWLFAINKSALLALFQREMAPVRRMFSRDGVTELAEGTIFVLRWGLWMAPIIFTFLRQMPTPTWYNQDGAIRTLFCIGQSAVLGKEGFEAWSLMVFMWVLAFDAFRVLIWLDHMGLRVATLVNLSFIGMERLDGRVARFLGADATARCFPEGIKRFTTWAPLLLPFYIPAGAAWDRVWAESQAIKLAAPSWIELVWRQAPGVLALQAGGCVAGVAMVVVLWRWRGAWRRAVESAPLELRNAVYSLSLGRDGAMRAEYLEGGMDVHRRSYEGRDPAGRVLFMAEADPGAPETWTVWPVLGNYPAEVGVRAEIGKSGRFGEASLPNGDMLTVRHEGRGLETAIQIELPEDDQAVELWTITVRNTGAGPRSVQVVPYVEWVLNTAEADRNHTQYNRLFPEVSYRADLGAALVLHRHTHLAGFMAADRDPEGIQVARVEFIGRAGTVWSPEAVREGRWRAPETLGPCPLLDAIGSLCLRVDLPAGGEQTVRVRVGVAESMAEAEGMIRKWKKMAPAKEGGRPGGASLPKAGTTLGHGEPPRGVRGPYSRFEDDGRILRVLTPFTPLPFDHTMSNKLGHVMAVTQRGLHTSASVNSQQNRLTPDWADTVTRELPGEAMYLFDVESGEWFSPTWEPLRERGAAYETEFRVDGTAVFHMRQGTVSTELTVFVPPDEPAGVYRLIVRNNGDRVRRFNCAAYFEMVLANRPEHAGVLSRWASADRRGLLFENPRNTFRTGSAFAAMSPAPEATVTRRGEFFGEGRGVAHPQWVEGVAARGGNDADDSPVAAFRVGIEVPPQSERTVVVVLGQSDRRAEAERVMALYGNPEYAEAQLEATRRWWNGYGRKLTVETTDRGFDGLLYWLKYQALAERLWARKGFYQASGAFGYRDQLQDSVNLIWADPPLARRQILLHAAQQFIQGDTVHWFFLMQNGQTGLASRSHASDNLLWLGWGVAEYVRMTGDVTILDERVPYLDTEVPLLPLPGGKSGVGLFPLRSAVVETLFEHVIRALDLVLGHRMGRNGLPLIGTGDWNDSFDEIGSEGRGESVWLGFFLAYVIREMLPLIERKSGAGVAAGYRRRLKALKAALEATWRGDRYLRAFHDDGTEIGVAGGGAWEVDVLTVAWAVMAGADPERARTGFDTALTILEKDLVILLGWPAVHETTRPRFGRVSHYPEGVRENGMYSHGVQWLVGAARMLAEQRQAAGDAEGAAKYRADAERLWRKISPLDHSGADRIEVYGGQPNKQAADYLTEVEPGRMIWSGYTGAAAWMVRQAMEGVIGATLEGNVVRMPDDLAEARGGLRVRRVWRGGEGFGVQA
jgi:cyclic beta-1,2-glucan synthetase